MNLDKYGLPVQADDDANDQLQRVGMICSASLLYTAYAVPSSTLLSCRGALRTLLQPKPGIYTRSVGSSPNNVSADQLIPVIASHILDRSYKQSALMFIRMISRLGFAQNYKDGLNDSTHYKLPDFMLFRAMPIFSRASLLFYPIALVADLYLVIMAITAVFDRNPDSVDDNNIIITLAVCSERNATPFSWLARKIYGTFRAYNYGCDETTVRYLLGCTYVTLHKNVNHPVYGALLWYHRTESGGNVEIAHMWKNIVYRWFV